METIFLWEKIVIAASIIAIGGPVIVGIFAFQWIGKNYFPKDN